MLEYSCRGAGGGRGGQGSVDTKLHACLSAAMFTLVIRALPASSRPIFSLAEVLNQDTNPLSLQYSFNWDVLLINPSPTWSHC